MEGIQEKEGRENPDPPLLEEEEDWSESKPSSLPWRQAGGEEEGTLADTSNLSIDCDMEDASKTDLDMDQTS